PSPEGPISLTFAEFEQAVEMLQHVGFQMERTAEEAWPEFRGWRVNYEASAYRLADRLTAPPAPWSGTRRHLRSGPVAPRRPPQRAPEGRRGSSAPRAKGARTDKLWSGGGSRRRSCPLGVAVTCTGGSRADGGTRCRATPGPRARGSHR